MAVEQDAGDVSNIEGRLREKNPEWIAEIERLREEKGRPPSTTEFFEETDYGYSTVRHYAKADWADVIEALGMDPERLPKQGPNGPDPRDVERRIRMIREIADEIGRPPYAMEAYEQCREAYEWMKRIPETESWGDRLRAIGFDVEGDYRRSPGRGTGPYYSDAELIYDLYAGALALGHSPSTHEVMAGGQHGRNTYYERFGDDAFRPEQEMTEWDGILVTLGLPPSGEPVDELELELRLEYLWDRYEDVIDSESAE